MHIAAPFFQGERLKDMQSFMLIGSSINYSEGKCKGVSAKGMSQFQFLILLRSLFVTQGGGRKLHNAQIDRRTGRQAQDCVHR